MKALLVTVRQAADALGIGRTSIYNLFSSGQLTPRKCGSRTLVSCAELEKLAEGLPVSTAARQGAAVDADTP